MTKFYFLVLAIALATGVDAAIERNWIAWVGSLAVVFYFILNPHSLD